MLIKSAFTRSCNDPLQDTLSPSKAVKRERNIWARRFWEHRIRNDEDYMRHVDYIHYNPVKHGLAASPSEWRFTSFHRYVNDGVYHPDWGAKEHVTFDDSIGNE